MTVKDAKNGLAINDYRWIIEEDRTFYIDPKCQINSTDPARSRPASCPPLPVQSLGYNFHTANMPVVATGCVGAVSCEAGQTLLGVAAACDVGNGVCHTDVGQKVELQPGQVYLDPTKRYYISILPGDGVNPIIGGAGGPVTVNGKDVPFNIAQGLRTLFAYSRRVGSRRQQRAVRPRHGRCADRGRADSADQHKPARDTATDSEDRGVRVRGRQSAQW